MNKLFKDYKTKLQDNMTKLEKMQEIWEEEPPEPAAEVEETNDEVSSVSLSSSSLAARADTPQTWPRIKSNPMTSTLARPSRRGAEAG